MLSQDQIKDFVVQNNVLGYAIAMIIALTLKDFVATFIGNFIVPAINLFLIQLQIKSLTKFLPGNEVVDILPIVKSLLTFILTFLLVFFSITLFFSSWVVPKRQLPSTDGHKDEEMMMM
jgi:large-conductance mechanosensitive channel